MLHYALLIYAIFYFVLAFVWRSVQVFKQTGINPLVLPQGDDAQSYIGRAFKYLIGAMLGVILTITFVDTHARWLGAYDLLNAQLWRVWGWALLLFALGLILIAQVQMGHAWRIGIDQKHATPLIQHGVFRFSRNPIFLAMRLNLLGLFFVYPALATAVIWIAGELLIQIQVRFEEAFLREKQGQVYLDYCQQTARWISIGL